MIPPPPRSTLFPYTTLFRSARTPRQRRTRTQSKTASAPAPECFGSSSRSSDSDEMPKVGDRKSTRLNSSHQIISYAVFCLKKKIMYTICIELKDHVVEISLN